MNLSKKLSQGMLTRRTSQQTLLEHFNRMATKDDFERIRDKWFTACEAEGLSLHNNVVLEFKKRIERCGQQGERAKLDFTNCCLDDRRLTLLIEALAKKPVIYKLDLDKNNITHEGAKIIRKLLKGQLKLVKDFDIDKRLHASFLAEVSLQHTMIDMSSSTMAKVQQALKILKYCNAQAYIRSVYINSSAPEQLSYPFVMKMWLNIVGKPDKDQIKPAFEAAGVEEKPIIFYKELEAVLLQGLIQRGLLQNVTSEELSTIETPGPLVRENSWDRLPTFNAVLTSSRPSGDYPSSLDGINVLDDSYVISPKTANRKTSQASSSTRQSASKKPRRSLESTRSEDSEDIGEDTDIFRFDDLDHVLKPRPLSMNSVEEEVVLSFEPSPMEDRSQLKKSLSTVQEANNEDDCVHKFRSSRTSNGSRPRSLEKIKENTHSLQNIENLQSPVHSGSTSTESHSFGQQHSFDSVGTKENPGNHSHIRIEQATAKPLTTIPMSDRSAEVIGSPQDNLISQSHIDIQEQSPLDDKPSADGGLWTDNESATLEISVASDSVEVVVSQSRFTDDPSHENQPPAVGGLSIKTSGPMFDSPNMVRVNTAEVYDAEDLFLESNPMHEEVEGILTTMASSSVEITGQARMGKSPARRPSRSGTPTNILRAQRESQSRTPQSLLRSTPQGQVLLGNQKGKEESERSSPSKQSDGIGSDSKTCKDKDSAQVCSSENFTSAILEVVAIPEVSSLINATNSESKSQPAPSSSSGTVRVLDLANKNIPELYLVEYLEPDMLIGLRVLVLRNIGLSSLLNLKLQRWVPALTDLDLGNNKLAGKLEEDSIPTKLLRLDLSYNQLTDVTSVMKCFELIQLDLSHNLLKNLYALPIKLERLNLSNNKLISVGSLRNVTMCSNLQSISILNNPMTSQIPNIRVFLMSLFRNLVEYDGVRFGNPKPAAKPVPKQKRIDNSKSPAAPTSNGSIPSNSTTAKSNSATASTAPSHRSSSVGKSNPRVNASNSFNINAATKASFSKKEQALNDQRRSELYLEKQKALEKAKVDRERQAIEALEGPKKKVVLKSDQLDRLTSRLTAPRAQKETTGVQGHTKSAQRQTNRRSSAPAAVIERPQSRPKERPQANISHTVYSNLVSKPKPSLLVSVLNTSTSSFRLQNVLKSADESDLPIHHGRGIIPAANSSDFGTQLPVPQHSACIQLSLPSQPSAISSALGTVLKGGRSTTPNSNRGQTQSQLQHPSYSSNKSPSSKFSDDGVAEGLKLNDINIKLPVTEYIEGISLELGRMAAAFKLVYMLFGKESLVEEDLVVFNSSFERFVQSDFKNIPGKVLSLLNGADSLSFVEEKHKINLYHEHYEKVIQLFTQIQTMLELAIQSGVNFHDSVQLLMNSKLGKHVNEHILAKYYCTFDEKAVSSPSRPVMQINTQPIPLSTPTKPLKDPVRSPTATPKTPTSESGDFVHKIREPVKENTDQSKDAEKISEDKSFGIADGSDHRGMNQANYQNSNPMERVRSRVVQKFLPTKVANNLISPDKGPITLRGGQKSSIRGGDSEISTQKDNNKFTEDVIVNEEREKLNEIKVSAENSSPIRTEKIKPSLDNDLFSMSNKKEKIYGNTNSPCDKEQETPTSKSVKDIAKTFSSNSPATRSVSAFSKPDLGRALTTSAQDVALAISIDSSDSSEINKGTSVSMSYSAESYSPIFKSRDEDNALDTRKHALVREGTQEKKRKPPLEDVSISAADQATENKLKRMLSSAPSELLGGSDFKSRGGSQDATSPKRHLYHHEQEIDEFEVPIMQPLKISIGSLSSSLDFNYPENDPTKRLLPDSPEHIRTSSPTQSSLVSTPAWKDSTTLQPVLSPIVISDKVASIVISTEDSKVVASDNDDQSVAKGEECAIGSTTTLIAQEGDDSSLGSTSSKMNAKERLKARLKRNRMNSEGSIQDGSIA